MLQSAYMSNYVRLRALIDYLAVSEVGASRLFGCSVGELRQILGGVVTPVIGVRQRIEVWSRSAPCGLIQANSWPCSVPVPEVRKVVVEPTKCVESSDQQNPAHLSDNPVQPAQRSQKVRKGR